MRKTTVLSSQRARNFHTALLSGVEEYLVIIFRYFFSYYSIKTYIVGTHYKCLTEVLLISIHYICFYWELEKTIPELLSNTSPLLHYKQVLFFGLLHQHIQYVRKRSGFISEDHSQNINKFLIKITCTTWQPTLWRIWTFSNCLHSALKITPLAFSIEDDTAFIQLWKPHCLHSAMITLLIFSTEDHTACLQQWRSHCLYSAMKITLLAFCNQDYTAHSCPLDAQCTSDTQINVYNFLFFFFPRIIHTVFTISIGTHWPEQAV